MTDIYFCDFLDRLRANGVSSTDVIFKGLSLVHTYRIVRVNGGRLEATKLTANNKHGSAKFHWEAAGGYRTADGARNFAKYIVGGLSTLKVGNKLLSKECVVLLLNSGDEYA